MSASFKLPARYAGLALSFVLTFLMTFVVSGISTLRAAGLGPEFPKLWMSSWGLSWLAAFPTILVVMPVARRIVAAITCSAR